MENKINIGRTNKVLLFFMTVPCVVLIILFSYVPLFGWSYAFIKYQPGKSVFASTFVGLKYFVDIVTTSEILPALRNTLIFSALGLMLSPMPALFAIVMSEIRSKRYQKFIQTTTTFPNFISWIVIYSMAMVIFSVDDGVLNNALMALGLIQTRFNLLGEESAVYALQTALGMWKGLGFSAIVYFAAIAGIDSELYDAAAVDGANRFQRMWHIKVPGLLPTYLVLFLLSIGNILNSGFEQFFVFYNPLIHDKIQVLDLYVYKIGLEKGNFSLSTAVGISKTFVSMVLLFSANFLSKRISGKSVL